MDRPTAHPWPRLMCEKTAAAYIDRSSSWLRNARYEDRERMARDEPPRGPRYIRQGSAIRYTIEDLDERIDGQAKFTS